MDINLEKNTRLAKKIAESGVASRREAENLIRLGHVSVDGEIITTPVFFVDDKSLICVNGQKISGKSDEVIIWKFYKPRGVITSKKDQQNRKTVFDFFKEKNDRLLYIGRLDYNSEGLLLFTNNGDIARKMELPSTALKRVYRARIFGKLSPDALQKMKLGVTIAGIKYGPVDVRIDRQNSNGYESSKSPANIWITVTLSEGKNREIRKIMEYFGCTVNKLVRISYGAFKLGDLQPGEVLQANKNDVEDFIKSLPPQNK